MEYWPSEQDFRDEVKRSIRGESYVYESLYCHIIGGSIRTTQGSLIIENTSDYFCGKGVTVAFVYIPKVLLNIKVNVDNNWRYNNKDGQYLLEHFKKLFIDEFSFGKPEENLIEINFNDSLYHIWELQWFSEEIKGLSYFDEEDDFKEIFIKKLS